MESADDSGLRDGTNVARLLHVTIGWWRGFAGLAVVLVPAR